MNNDGSEHANYFNFLKNLKNQPDSGLPPLVEWKYVIDFVSRTFNYLLCEWDIDIDKTVDFTNCTFDEYPTIFRHRQNIVQIIVDEFRRRGSIANASTGVVDYLRNNELWKSKD